MLRKARLTRWIVACAALAGAVTLVAQASGQGRDQVRRTITEIPAAVPVTAQNGMVVAQEARAARVGADILQQGGNAIDAAVAVGFAMAVTYPRAGNIGGGGFMVIHRADGSEAAIDYRETAPQAVNDKTFLDAEGRADPAKSRDSALAVGVPGTVAGLALALEKYGSGRFTLAQLIAPAIALARDGIPIEADIADTLPDEHSRVARWPASRNIFLKADGSALMSGDRLMQSDLAGVLETIAKAGPRAFYEGPIADKIAAAVQGAGGVMTAQDLAGYRAIERTPVRGTYRGYDIVSMPPPSSGGVHLIEMLNILESYDMHAAEETEALHLMIEAMKRAYADRAVFLDDPDRADVPVARLISKDYAAQWRATIDLAHATPSKDIRAGATILQEGRNTTHYSVADRFGNAVANTYTLNFSFGLGLVAEGTGILLNNELDDFAAAPGAPNAFGLIGLGANAPGPGKRPLSSMTPTIVLKDSKPYLITGSPGGSRIITAVLQVVVNVIDRGLTLAQAVQAPRVHHQWLPDQVAIEPGFPAALVEGLAARGHHLAVRPPFTSANSILMTEGHFVGVADPRTRASLAVGY